MNEQWKRALMIAMLVGLGCACTSMRDSSRYWTDTIAHDGAPVSTAPGKDVPATSDFSQP